MATRDLAKTLLIPDDRRVRELDEHALVLPLQILQAIAHDPPRYRRPQGGELRTCGGPVSKLETRERRPALWASTNTINAMSDALSGTEWVELNRLSWDERVPIHVQSRFYDVEGFKSGDASVQPFEIEELGALGGQRLAHLQCHFGMDTLDLVRMHPTLEAVGLDFSAPAVAQASKLAAQLDLHNRVRFVEADVRRAVEVLGSGSFDVVYTGKGAICWLPDLAQWAEQCAGLLRPGGYLYLCEFHPVGYALGPDGPSVEFDYFTDEPYIDDEPGSYADQDASTVHNVTYSWNHPLYRIFGALLGAGFDIRFFHEWDHTLFPYASWLVKGDDGCYRWPGRGRLPLMFSMKAEKPSR